MPGLAKILKNLLKSEYFGTFRKFAFGGVLGVGSAAKVVPKRSRVTSDDKKFMLMFFDNSIGEGAQKYWKLLGKVCIWHI